MLGQDAASVVLAARFADALCAWLTGSAGAGDARATSDLDLVVIVGEDAASFRETFLQGSQLIELFVHNPASLAYWYGHERREYRCTLAHMVATGRALMPGTLSAELQRDAALHVRAGPTPRSQSEIDALRYGLSSAIDDLTDAGEEGTFVAVQVMMVASELRLAVGDSWTGSGKWLHRWLERVDPKCAQDLSAGLRQATLGDVHLLIETAEAVLALAGGRLQEGYRLG